MSVQINTVTTGRPRSLILVYLCLCPVRSFIHVFCCIFQPFTHLYTLKHFPHPAQHHIQAAKEPRKHIINKAGQQTHSGQQTAWNSILFSISFLAIPLCLHPLPVTRSARICRLVLRTHSCDEKGYHHVTACSYTGSLGLGEVQLTRMTVWVTVPPVVRWGEGAER